MAITYDVEPSITLREFEAVLHSSGLAERRPVDDSDCLQGMIDNSNLVVTARIDGELIGVARSVTDFHFCCYLSDLAVSKAHQGKGVGVELQRRARARLGPNCKLILISAPAAMDYYPKIGYERCDRCFLIGRDEPLSSER